MFIGISGIIGAGKTTLTRDLAERLGYKAYYEPVIENVYLGDFYHDMKRWGGMMQLYLLFKRFEQHQKVVWTSEEGAVQDRTIYEDTIFARMLHESGHIDERDYTTYMGHFNIMKRYLVYPDIIVYLRVDPLTAHERVMKRGRHVERAIGMDYLQRLHQGYEEFAEEMSHWTRVVTIDWSEFLPADEVARQVLEESHTSLSFLRNLKRI